MNPDAPPYLPPLVVVVRDGAGRTRREAFLRSPVRIGRDPAADLVLDAPWVSARHGLVQFDEAAAFYTDLGSRNGTAAGGRPVPPHAPVRLEPELVLELGPLRLSFERASLPRARGAGPGEAEAVADAH